MTCYLEGVVMGRDKFRVSLKFLILSSGCRSDGSQYWLIVVSYRSVVGCYL